ncbi:fatty acid desaturase family protein [Microlunatus antarcticus]|uniref:Fatty acid desaturase n=1 Tax=Microlunatus antarcticus TaxID=53388 RepID=A0A7W5P572_9ACTN|nr:fatty acid desaturase [Microlunatus antarcticus]
MPSSVPSAVPSAATARLASQPLTRSFTALTSQVRTAGLLGRTRGFYALVFGLLLLALGGIATGVVLLGESWLQLLMAGALGLVLTQFAFLGHEASHRQIFVSGKANDRSGRILAVGFAGLSYSWWMTKHTRHHGNPNQVGKDPDIARDTVSFHEADAAAQRGLSRWITARQSYLFFPLLLLEGVNLHFKSVQSLLQRGPVKGRKLELAMLGVRFGLYAGVLFWFLPLGMAAAFIGVQLAVFGFYMGGTFAPNHMGMPIVPADAKLDFLSKQVRTSRNITGGIWMSALMGGLNYQVEHHLFPSMPRPHLRAARAMVREHCRTLDVPYTETNLIRAYHSVLAHLDRVGLKARDPFDCPAAGNMRFG